MKCQTVYLREGRTDVTLTTYVLEDSPEMLGGKRRPAVIVCPGGAYLSCSDREGEPVAMQFAAMGYHAFVLRYGIYTEGAPGMFFPEPGTKLEPMVLKPVFEAAAAGSGTDSAEPVATEGQEG